jgi:hypothetical protein
MGRPIRPAVTALMLAGVTTTAALAAPPAPTEDCNAAAGVMSFVACAGAFAGNDNPADLSSFSAHVPGGVASWSLIDKTDGTDGTQAFTFTNNPHTPSGTLSFSQAISGWFAVSLKGANQHSVYLFDGGTAGLSSIDYSMIGTAVNKHGEVQSLSHASLWGVTPVPEPDAYALLLAGLGLVGFVARRRNAR